MNTNKGYVAFVGAGPGDIGLITTKGIECLKKQILSCMIDLPIHAYYVLQAKIVCLSIVENCQIITL